MMVLESEPTRKKIYEVARSRIFIALDNFSSVDESVNFAGGIKGYIGGVKIGKELHIMAGREGVDIFEKFYDLDIATFADLKLHDTPNTVYQSSRGLCVPGVYMFNVHVSGGEEMCRKALEGSRTKNNYSAMEKTPLVIGVTELTSLDDSDLEAQGLGIKYNDLVRKRTELARKWGLAGVVCPANKAGALEEEFGSDFLYVTPGIEWEGLKGSGQKQLYTPGLAVRDCKNSILIIGGAATKAEDPLKALQEMCQDMGKYL